MAGALRRRAPASLAVVLGAGAIIAGPVLTAGTRHGQAQADVQPPVEQVIAEPAGRVQGGASSWTMPKPYTATAGETSASPLPVAVPTAAGAPALFLPTAVPNVAAEPLPTSSVTGYPTMRPAVAHTPAGPPPDALQVIALINQDRTANGLAPLTTSAALSRAAEDHAQQNAAQNQMFHAGLYADVSQEGVTWSTIGEVLAYWSAGPDASAVNGMWLQSPEHRSVILTPGYTTIGAGWAQGSSGNWYVSAILIS